MSADVYRYDPVNDSYAAVAPLPQARLDGVVRVVGGKLYALGGNEPGLRATDVCTVYDPATNTWRQLTPMPNGRRSHAGAVLGGLIYTISGVNTSNFLIAVVEAYDPATDTWHARAPYPAPAQYISAEAVNGKTYAFGGNGFYDRVQEYDPVTDAWTEKGPVPLATTPTPSPTPSATPTATPRAPSLAISVMSTGVIGNLIYAAGSTGTWVYDPAADHWSGPLATMPVLPAELAATGVFNGRLYVIGGTGSGTATQEFTPPSSPTFTPTATQTATPTASATATPTATATAATTPPTATCINYCMTPPPPTPPPTCQEFWPITLIHTVGKGQSPSNNIKVSHWISGHIVDPLSLGPTAHRIPFCRGTTASVQVGDSFNPPNFNAINTPNSTGISCDNVGCTAQNIQKTEKYISRSADGEDTDRMTFLVAK